MTTAEDRDLWERDEEASRQQTAPSPHGGLSGGSDLLDRERVARYAERLKTVYDRHNLATYAKAILPLVDEELSALRAENERLREAAEAHWDARTLECPGCGSGEEGCCVCSQMKRADRAEAALAVARAQVKAVRAVADRLGDEVRRLFHDENDPRGAGRVMGALSLIRDALSSAAADTPEPASPDDPRRFATGGPVPPGSAALVLDNSYVIPASPDTASEGGE